VKKGWDEVGIIINLDKKKGCGKIFGGIFSFNL
jgi:hypothetical protein